MIHISDWLPTFAKIAGVTVDRPIDGKNVWTALSHDLESPRSEVLVHYDQATPYMAYIADNYKIVSGSTYKGAYDRWLSQPIDPTELNATFSEHYGKAILSSRAGQILKKYSKTYKAQPRNDGQQGKGIISTSEIEEIRAKAQVTCNGHVPPANNSDEACHPVTSPCLFDIVNDPCETTNLAKQFPDILQKLQAKLDYYGRIALPIRNKPADPRCDPANFNGIWTWWVDELNVTKIAKSSGMKKQTKIHLNFTQKTINLIWWFLFI